MGSVEISVQILSESDKAFKVTDGNRVVWIGKSQITDSHTISVNPNRAIDIEIPEWLAKKEDLV